ncbi:hypothetical protein VZT92_009552 [Zoarces viviparus]|uniref:C2 domain-containing protein n=2 Tax=Zoarces viviparus TaxID=48416 RepID=A0AAW1FC42_ZOAVI
MELSDADESGASSQQQTTMWRLFQARAKPLLSPKLDSRDPEDKKDRGGGWMFKKMKRREHAVLDRVISSSQPDLLFSAPLCGKAPTHSPKKSTVAHLVQSHHKSSSLGSACLESLAEPPSGDSGSSGGGGSGDEAATAAAATAETQMESRDEQPGLGAPGSSGMYKLEVELKRGRDLAVRDRRGSSDPYVKFKLAGKEVFRSRTIHKNLNPEWDQKTTLIMDCLSEPLYVKVFDYDFGLLDDFMGSAYLHLESLEQQRTIL